MSARCEWCNSKDVKMFKATGYLEHWKCRECGHVYEQYDEAQLSHGESIKCTFCGSDRIKSRWEDWWTEHECEECGCLWDEPMDPTGQLTGV